MTDDKRVCLMTRLRSIMENMLTCGYHLEHEQNVKMLIRALDDGSNLTELQIERAILVLENEELERHRTMLRDQRPVKDEGH